eukprot:861241-Prymnesium_polylepis.1
MSARGCSAEDFIRHFPGRPLVGMDSEGKGPIAKVQLAIYSCTTLSIYILDVSTASGKHNFNKFLDAIRHAEGIIALERDFNNGSPPEEQDAFLLRDMRPHLTVIDLYAEARTHQEQVVARGHLRLQHTGQ